MKIARSLSLLAALLVGGSALAQLTPAVDEPIRGMRMPTLSPDGTKIAFQYRGDIWMVGADGGIATRVTAHVELETRPIWSPDGRWLAFSSDRNGNFDVFAIPVTGGEPRQLTYSGGNEIATDWSPDGKWITFTAQRDAPFTGIFVLDVRTLDFKKITEDYQGLGQPYFTPDGKSIISQRFGYPSIRPRYHGSSAAQIIVTDIATGQRKTIVKNDNQKLWPLPEPKGDGFYCVTYTDVTPSSRKFGEAPAKFVDTPARTPNLYHFDWDGTGKRLTNFVGETMRSPSISDTGDIAFEKDGSMFVLSKGNVKKLDVRVFDDQKAGNIERTVITTGATEAVITPDEKTFVFVAGNELWSIPIEKPEGRNKDDATRLTDWTGVDGQVVMAKDGKQVFFISDRNFNDRLFSLNLETKEVKEVWATSEDITGPQLSPDARSLAFWVTGSQGGIYVWNIDSGMSPKRVYAQGGTMMYGTSGGDFAWSPDGKWMAITGVETGGTENVKVLNLETGKFENVTKRAVAHSAPAWSADGKYLYYFSNRAARGYYILPLKPEDESPGEIKLKYAKPTGSVKVEIDFNDIEDRARKLFDQQPDSDLFSDSNSGTLFFTSSGGLWQASYDGKDVRQIVGGVSQFKINGDSKKAYVLANGTPAVVQLSNNYPVSPVAFRAELVQDMNQVRKSAFLQYWRIFNRGFYDGNFHGRNWEAIRQRYEPQLQGVGHRREMADLLNMMTGELESSHSEIGPAPGGPRSPQVSHPGFSFDYSYTGPGIKVLSTYRNAAATFKKTEIKPGEIVLAINGTPVSLNEKLWSVLHDQGGRDLVFTVATSADSKDRRTVRYAASSLGEYGELRYRQWVQDNQKRIHDASNGKVGYIHIRGMGGGDKTRFDEEFQEEKRGKEVMIIDVRFNGGGNIADSLVDILERKQHGWYRMRDSVVEVAPNDTVWEKPNIVLMNENSASNGEMFPYSVHQRGLGMTIGFRTQGYVIWTYGPPPLVDGTSYRMPMGAVWRMDGSPMENNGEIPDISIPWSNEDFFAGKDPQLDRAIQEALKKIK